MKLDAVNGQEAHNVPFDCTGLSEPCSNFVFSLFCHQHKTAWPGQVRTMPDKATNGPSLRYFRELHSLTSRFMFLTRKDILIGAIPMSLGASSQLCSMQLGRGGYVKTQLSKYPIYYADDMLRPPNSSLNFTFL